MRYTHPYLSPLGGITIASDGSALTGLWFDGQKYFGAGLEKTPEEKSLPIFDQADRWLDLYFSGRAPDFTPPLVLTGTEFRKDIWNILMTIPFGRTRTYGEIAAQFAAQKGLSSMSAQAVGLLVSIFSFAAFITAPIFAPSLRPAMTSFISEIGRAHV